MIAYHERSLRRCRGQLGAALGVGRTSRSIGRNGPKKMRWTRCPSRTVRKTAQFHRICRHELRPCDATPTDEHARIALAEVHGRAEEVWPVAERADDDPAHERRRDGAVGGQRRRHRGDAAPASRPPAPRSTRQAFARLQAMIRQPLGAVRGPVSRRDARRRVELARRERAWLHSAPDHVTLAARDYECEALSPPDATLRASDEQAMQREDG